VLIDASLRTYIDAHNAETQYTVEARLYNILEPGSSAGAGAYAANPVLVLCYEGQQQRCAQRFPPLVRDLPWNHFSLAKFVKVRCQTPRDCAPACASTPIDVV
jgi:hypothetical protein